MGDQKKTLVVDFDGVLHSYSSGWTFVDAVTDPPVPGAIAWLREAVKHFHVCIVSTRSHDPRGKAAMQEWLGYWAVEQRKSDKEDLAWLSAIDWPTVKPPAFVTLDDRAITFTGTFPSMDQIKSFRTWQQLGKK
jgi:hypothetical protein